MAISLIFLLLESVQNSIKMTLAWIVFRCREDRPALKARATCLVRHARMRGSSSIQVSEI